MLCVQHQIIRTPHICQKFTVSNIKTTMLQTKLPFTHGMFQTCIKQQCANHEGRLKAEVRMPKRQPCLGREPAQQCANHVTLFHTTLNGEGFPIHIPCVIAIQCRQKFQIRRASTTAQDRNFAEKRNAEKKKGATHLVVKHQTIQTKFHGRYPKPPTTPGTFILNHPQLPTNLFSSVAPPGPHHHPELDTSWRELLTRHMEWAPTLDRPAIQIQEANPKKPGSKAFERFDRYKTATTIGDATAKGANWQDLTGDFEKEYLKIPDLMPVDAAGPGSTKRAAPEGTPDREADATSKMSSTTTIVPKALIPEASEPVSKVEMSAATIAALRGMMRDEIKNGMLEMEHRFTKQLDRAIGDMKEEMKVETTARQQLEERILHLEQNLSKQSNSTTDAGNEGEVDKAVAVVGGFVDKAIEEVESLVAEMMRGVHGYKEVEIIDITPPLALATFDTPVQAMKYTRAQKRNATVQTNTLWVSENRSKSERMRCKAVSKLKKILIELGEFEPSNIIVNYKSFKVMARISSKLVPVANVTADLDVEWLDNNIVNEEVSGAMTNFMSDLE